MFKWLFHILIFATNGSGKYQNKEKPLKRQRNLGLQFIVLFLVSLRMIPGQSVSLVCMCFNILLVLQYFVCVSIFCMCFNILYVFQYFECVSIFCVSFNTLYVFQHFVCVSIFCIFINILYVFQYFICLSIFCMFINILYVCANKSMCAD